MASVNITGTSFADLEAALKKVQTRSNSVHKRIDKIFNTDYTNAKVFSGLDRLSGKLAILSIRARSLATDLKSAASVLSRYGGGSGGLGGGRSGRSKGPMDYLDDLAMRSYRNQNLSKTLLGFQSGSTFAGSGNPFFVSKFGNPGQMPLVSRFRVFQRPFPGSERNPFALGDAGNIANNLIYSTGKSLETVFKGIVSAGTDSVRVLGAFGQVGLAGFASIAKSIPLVGKFLEKTIVAFAQVLEFGTRAFTGFIDKLGGAIGGFINLTTNIGLGLSGLAYRAIQAASTLTELKNAAAIYVGQGSQRLVGTAMDYQARFGLSATDSLRIMTRVAGQVRQTTGVGGEAAAQDAVRIFQSVSEAGSVLNMSIDDIGKTIQSALAGRYTPLRRIGVAVSAPYLDMIAQQQGFTQTAKTPFEARTKALIQEITRQTAPFMGDLAATQYEFANQQRKILGLFESIFVQAGRILEPFAKIILITSNEALTMLNDKLRAAADAFSNINPEFFSKFGAVVARAGDYAIMFAKQLYDAREAIGDRLAGLFETVAFAARDLIVYSLRMVSVVAGLIESFHSLTPTIKDLTLSIAGFAEFVSRQVGTQTPAQKKADEAYSQDLTTVTNARVRTSNYKKWYNILDMTTGEQLNALQNKAKEAQARIDQVNNGMPRSFVYGTQQGPLFGTSTFEKLQSLSDALQNVNSVPDLQKLFTDIFGTAPAVLSNPASKLAVPERNPLFIPPGEFEKQTGSLAKYFNPAAFRDEVQTRQLDAMQQTAENTGRIADILESGSFRQGAGPLLTPSLTTP